MLYRSVPFLCIRGLELKRGGTKAIKLNQNEINNIKIREKNKFTNVDLIVLFLEEDFAVEMFAIVAIKN